MVILDTDHLTWMQEEESAAKARLLEHLQGMDSTEIATTIITYEEQMRGWLAFKARAKNPSREIAAYANLRKHIEHYRTVNVLDFDEAAAAEVQRLRRLKIRVGTMDLKIAAIAIVQKATLLSRNLVDFRKDPGLKVQDWTQ
jgi:tRNA(fMet)-specific endonuclease VapC